MDWKYWKQLPASLGDMIVEVLVGQFPLLACGTIVMAAFSAASSYAALQAGADTRFQWMPLFVSHLNLKWDAVALILAIPLAWHKRRMKAKALEVQLDGLTNPKFSARIERLVFDKHRGTILACVSLSNEGASSTTEKWGMSIDVGDRTYDGKPLYMGDLAVVHESIGERNHPAKSFLSETVTVPISQGAPLKAPLVLTFHDLIGVPIDSEKIKCNLKFKDYRGEWHSLQGVTFEGFWNGDILAR